MPRLNHTTRHSGVFTNSNGTTKDAYIFWNIEKEGFVIYDATTNRPLINTAYPSLAAMKEAKINFTVTYAKEMAAVA